VATSRACLHAPSAATRLRLVGLLPCFRGSAAGNWEGKPCPLYVCVRSCAGELQVRPSDFVFGDMEDGDGVVGSGRTGREREVPTVRMSCISWWFRGFCVLVPEDMGWCGGSSDVM